MRGDVREALERAAADELRFNGNYIALVSQAVAEELSDPSGPYRVAIVAEAGDPVVNIVLERMEVPA